jgi:glutathione S-transferase
MLAKLAPVVVLLNVLLLFWCMFLVGRARGKTGIKAPATAGHPDFERAFRAHMNTVEATVLFLPTYLIAWQYWRADWAALIGLIWIVGRIWFAWAYVQASEKRGPGFVLGMAAWATLLLGASYGVLRTMF